MNVQSKRDISRTVEDKGQVTILSSNMKSYMPSRLAQQRMILNVLEWPFHGSASRAISAVAELLVCLLDTSTSSALEVVR